MSTLQEIEKAVQDLSPDQLAAFREWFVEYDQALWDKQLERDDVRDALRAGDLKRASQLANHIYRLTPLEA